MSSSPSSRLTLILRALGPKGPFNYDVELLGSLKPATRVAYRKAISKFAAWLQREGKDPLFAGELDQDLRAYAGAEHLTRGQFEQLVSAVEKVLPQVKGLLPWSKSLLSDWRIRLPPKNTIPMPWKACLYVACALAMQGLPRPDP